MTIQNHITIFTGDTQNNVQGNSAGANKADHSSGNQNSKTFYAGNLLTEFPLRDRIQQRRAQAQERAMKIVDDAWGGDRKIDDELARSRDHVRELQAEKREAQDNIKWLTEQQESLAETYGVAEDSQEKKDLDLLAKQAAARKGGSGIEFSPEEKERLEELWMGERTEYQKRWLELNGQIGTYRDIIEADQRKMIKENMVIRGIREEKRKIHKMVDAQGQAEEVLEASQKEIIGMVTDEARDHIDEEQEKREEEAEAIKEKKEEQEEILEERREKEKELEELMEDMPIKEFMDVEDIQAQVQKEIQDVVNKMNLVVEDIKGAKVDQLL